MITVALRSAPRSCLPAKKSCLLLHLMMLYVDRLCLLTSIPARNATPLWKHSEHVAHFTPSKATMTLHRIAHVYADSAHALQKHETASVMRDQQGSDRRQAVTPTVATAIKPAPQVSHWQVSHRQLYMAGFAQAVIEQGSHRQSYCRFCAGSYIEQVLHRQLYIAGQDIC